MKLGHIGIAVSDLQASKDFYDAIASSVGLEIIHRGGTSVRYGNDDSTRFYIHTEKTPTHSLHLCFEVDTQKQVDEFYTAALIAGGTDNGAPGIREDYSPTYYAAFVLDPDGNNIEAVCR